MNHEDFSGSLPPPVRGSAATYVAKEDQLEEDKRWMREALLMAEEAFEALEVPVGSVFVRDGRIIAKGRNRTNELMNVSCAPSGRKAIDALVLYGLTDRFLRSHVCISPPYGSPTSRQPDTPSSRPSTRSSQSIRQSRRTLPLTRTAARRATTPSRIPPSM